MGNNFLLLPGLSDGEIDAVFRGRVLFRGIVPAGRFLVGTTTGRDSRMPVLPLRGKTPLDGKATIGERQLSIDEADRVEKVCLEAVIGHSKAPPAALNRVIGILP